MTNAELDQLFPLGPDSFPQPGVPQGRMEKHTHAASRIFPGTVRDYWIYIPAQYDAAHPACVTIVQDGEAHFSPERRWRIPTILDNLIHQGAIPITIGIFINPGIIPATRDGAPERHQRSFEYDSPTDRYARFLIEEILPAVAARYALRTDPDSRLILGGSSGAFCAFNAVWHRPDAFRRVFSCVGSYVGLRGGHNAASLVRLAEPKPLRVFLEGGDDDLNVYAGDWWTANTDMLSALRYAGYEVNHAFAAKAGHNDYHGSSIFPDALRWLWQDYPQPIRAGVGSRQPITSLAVPGEGWQCMHAGSHHVCDIAANAAGEIFFIQEEDPSIYRLTARGAERFFTDEADFITTIAFAPDGHLYAAQTEQRRILVIDPTGYRRDVISDLAAVRLCVGPRGELYTVDRGFREIWLTKPNGHRHSLTHDVMYVRDLCITADGTQLIVGDATGPIAWQLSIAADGTLAHPEPCYQLILPTDGLTRQTWDIAAHPKRWSFIASGADVQVAEHDGRIVGIFSPPAAGTLNHVVLTGFAHDQLYVACDGKIYRRPLRTPENLWH